MKFSVMLAEKDAKKLVDAGGEGRFGDGVTIEIVGFKPWLRRLSLAFVTTFILFLVWWFTLSLTASKNPSPKTVTGILAGRPTINQRGDMFIEGMRKAYISVKFNNNSDEDVQILDCYLDVSQLRLEFEQVEYYLPPGTDPIVASGRTSVVTFVNNNLNYEIRNTEDRKRSTDFFDCQALVVLKSKHEEFIVEVPIWCTRRTQGEVPNLSD